ncbi:aromatic-L-amino-acid decarboxylase [Venturia nashicola]|uniref:Aromatic-L-amino-acid decarboxylase n=1 Tax=Venturia nashicola TaxID=86259 RepID=A0A4Z1P254_9PEZI|nr:aromatic-L-amino-acid decarboxylase [Venturia nashicola]TLD27819.1 aromatic-L-amino-acid decarboxylase [Venturia nashicola]
MDADQFREAAHAVIEEVINYNKTLPSRRVVSSVSPGYLRPLLPESAPQEPQSWDTIQPDIENLIMPGMTHWQHPNFMAFFPANTSYPSILGEVYSAAFSAPAFNWLCSPAVTELETVVMDWIAKALALPTCFLSDGEGGGVIQGSASEAIVTVMVGARERAFRRLTEHLGEDGSQEVEDGKDALRGKLVALGSEQAHSSTQKGALITSTKYRTVPAYKQDQFGVRGATLKATLEQCVRDGLVPFYLTVSLGTTGTCAVDYFEEIVEVLKEYPNVWVHVDAAYAGSAVVCPEYQHHVKHFGSFDSFDFNMHKWLLTNFDASCLFLKTRRYLTSALSITPSYLRNSFSDSGLVTDYRDWQIPLGRRFRALKIWFVLRSYGISGLQAHIRGHIKLGEYFHSLILTRPDLFSVLAGPSFALNVITINPHRSKQRRLSAANRPDPDHERYLNNVSPDAEAQALVDANRITKEVYETVNARGEIYLTSSVIAGIYVIRIVSAAPGVEEKYLTRAFEILVEVSEEVLDKEEGEKK